MLPKCSVLKILYFVYMKSRFQHLFPGYPLTFFFLEKLVFKFLYSTSQKGHVIKHGLDWIGKTWTGLTKHGVIKHGLIKQGVI